MKTLVESYDSSTHGLIISNVYTKFKNEAPKWIDKVGGMAETLNSIGNVVIYQVTKKEKVKRIEVSNEFIKQLYNKIKELEEQKTEPDFPDVW